MSGIPNFDPNAKYGQYTIVVSENIEDGKERILEQVKLTVPEEHLSKVVMSVNDYDPVLAEHFFGIKEKCYSIAWKYIPE